MQIAVFHLYNDFSGSPGVLAPLLHALADRGVLVDLHTSRGGVLDTLVGVPGIRFYRYGYAYSPRPLVTVMRYAGVQLRTFFSAFRYLFSRRIFYINTLLPIGPALAGRLMGKRVVYHYHENAGAKGRLYSMLAKGMQWLASDIVCVSEYQRAQLKRTKRVYVVPNALSQEFEAQLKPDISGAFDRRRVLMISSLKGYKGTKEFVRLAEMLPQYRFELVINDSRDVIDDYWKEENLPSPPNLTVLDRQERVAPFYNRASLVVNLTNKEEAVETFGMTALEAMAAGLPVIVPTEGGVAEMVDDDNNGYKIDVKDLDKIAAAIREILSDREKYEKMATAALERSRRFSFARSSEAIFALLTAVEA